MPQNITRIAFLGDSITEGNGAIVNTTMEKNGTHGYLTNGAKFGNEGFPYLLSQLIKKHNLTDKYEVLNFGFGGRHIMDTPFMVNEWQSNSYWQTCDLVQAMHSQSQIFVIMFGTNDILHDRDIIDEGDFMKQGYRDLIRLIKNLKHKP